MKDVINYLFNNIYRPNFLRVDLSKRRRGPRFITHKMCEHLIHQHAYPKSSTEVMETLQDSSRADVSLS